MVASSSCEGLYSGLLMIPSCCIFIWQEGQMSSFKSFHLWSSPFSHYLIMPQSPHLIVPSSWELGSQHEFRRDSTCILYLIAYALHLDSEWCFSPLRIKDRTIYTRLAQYHATQKSLHGYGRGDSWSPTSNWRAIYSWWFLANRVSIFISYMPLKGYPCSSRRFLQPNNIQAALSKLSGLVVWM